MEKKRWIDIIVKKEKLDKDYVITPVNQELPFYLVEGINLEKSIEESLLVYDCSANSIEDKFYYDEMMREVDEHTDSYPVVVFNDWEHERKIYWKYYEALKASERKRFSSWYEKKISIYVDSKEDVVLEVDDRGINYLEYPVEKEKSSTVLKGRIYNISFFELKKLFNVTGNHLFVNNVRYGLKSNRIGNALKSKFREYLSVAFYKRAIELHFSIKLIEDMKEILEVDEEFVKSIEYIVAEESNVIECDWSYHLPENFWFYHNGISIYSYDVNLQTPANKIILCPDKVSVINGAQTLTNFFLEVEAVQRLLESVFEGKNISVSEIMESIIQKIYVKTIIINGNDKFVRPITHGLNTQIPILEEALFADTNTTEAINRILEQNSSASNRIKILKDGEFWTGERGVNTLDFVKHWLTINNKPGKSKNFAKKQLSELLNEIKIKLNNNVEDIHKLEIIFQIYEWWDNSRLRYNRNNNNEKDLIIGKYGKNYFGSYALNDIFYSQKLDSLDESYFSILYEHFLDDLKEAEKSTGISLNLGCFKKDELSEVLFEIQAAHRGGMRTIESNDFEEVEEELKTRLNQKGQSVYSFSKTIADYFIEKNMEMDYFRVISRTEGKCKESFPFPNSTFTELVDYFMTEEQSDKKPKAFEESVFAKAINRTFSVFIIDKDDDAMQHNVTGVHWIREFSFEEFAEEAKNVYDKTVEAFELGDETVFPRSGEKMNFHIRPKAVNAEDTFQFTNGNYITKRTFWANKETVESIILQKIEK